MNPPPEFDPALVDYSSHGEIRYMHENLPMFMEHATPSEEALLDCAACAHGAVALDPQSETLRRVLAVVLSLVQRTRAYRLLSAKEQARVQWHFATE